MVDFIPTCQFSALNISKCGQYTVYGGKKKPIRLELGNYTKV